MLSFNEALAEVLNHTRTLPTQTLPLRQALGLAAAEDIVSNEDLPGFDNSAVDGYAIDLSNVSKLKVQGEVRAGTVLRGSLKKGYAVRIFTGAPVPLGAKAVVMQEETETPREGEILIKKSFMRLGENIRFSGEDIQKGQLLVKKGTVLGPVHLAVLKAIGQNKVPVYSVPKVGILSTGSELLKDGERLKPGKIRDSNTILLDGLVQKIGGRPFVWPAVSDQKRDIREAIRRGLSCDVLLVAGGVSVGKYDFVKEGLKKEGVHEIFWKVDMKPGKPIFFGKKNQTLVFGLPGNPVSVFIAFEEFVKPVLFKMKGRADNSSFFVEGRMAGSFQNGPRLHFVRVKWQEKNGKVFVHPLKGQGSHQLGTLAESNGVIRLEPRRFLRRGERVSVKISEEL